MEGIFGIKPEIKKLDFINDSKVSLHLEDGREIICPLSFYPSIEKLTKTERKKYKIIKGQMIMFDDIDEIYHLQNFLGLQQDYVYAG